MTRSLVFNGEAVMPGGTLQVREAVQGCGREPDRKVLPHLFLPSSASWGLYPARGRSSDTAVCPLRCLFNPSSRGGHSGWRGEVGAGWEAPEMQGGSQRGEPGWREEREAEAQSTEQQAGL